MSENKPVIDQGWHDPDDAPELTDDILDVAEFAIGGHVIRPASGVLTVEGVQRFAPTRIEVQAAPRPRGLVRVYAQAGKGEKAMTGKTTGPKAAKAASATLSSGSTGTKSKTAAGSALSQAETKSKTSSKAASAASATMRDGRTATKSKTAAASALSQAGKKK